MSPAYFDTSVFAKLLLREPGSDRAWESWLSASPPLSCLVTLVEARAAMAAAFRSGRLDRSQHDDAKRALDELWEEVSPITLDRPLVDLAGELAEAHALRGYDAVHLAAALTTGAELFVSADSDQLRAAQAESMATLDPAAVAP